MHEVLRSRLSTIRFAEKQVSGPFSVFPILDGEGAGVDYFTLSEALKAGLLIVSEVHEAGSVPEVLVQNVADKAVLILDGEELAGAKQNRILNTTILVEADSRLRVPVSCTEAGRWEYRSRQFEDSGVVAAHSVRYTKNESVHARLMTGHGHASDQGRVWASISEYSERAGFRSATGALREAQEVAETRVRARLGDFLRIEGQVGFAVVAGGRPLGMDFVSRADAWISLHDKLLSSYLADVWQEEGSADGDAADVAIDALVQDLLSAAWSEHPSPGMGRDHRLEGVSSFASALMVDEEVVHLAAFRRLGEDRAPESGGMADWGWRRRSRQR